MSFNLLKNSFTQWVSNKSSNVSGGRTSTPITSPTKLNKPVTTMAGSDAGKPTSTSHNGGSNNEAMGAAETSEPPASVNQPININAGATSKQRSEQGNPSQQYGTHSMRRSSANGTHDQPKGNKPTGSMADHPKPPEFISDQHLEDGNLQSSCQVPKVATTDTRGAPLYTQRPYTKTGPAEPNEANQPHWGINCDPLDGNPSSQRDWNIPDVSATEDSTLHQDQQGLIIPANSMQYGSVNVLVGTQLPNTRQQGNDAGYVPLSASLQPSRHPQPLNGATTNQQPRLTAHIEKPPPIRTTVTRSTRSRTRANAYECEASAEEPEPSPDMVTLSARDHATEVLSRHNNR